MFENIVLEPVQEELLTVIVEAARNVARDQRIKFLVAQSVGEDSLIHPGIPEDKSKIYSGISKHWLGKDCLPSGMCQRVH